MLADSGNKSSVLGGKDGGGEFSPQKATAVRMCEDSCQPADGHSLKSSLDNYYFPFLWTQSNESKLGGGVGVEGHINHHFLPPFCRHGVVGLLILLICFLIGYELVKWVKLV